MTTIRNVLRLAMVGIALATAVLGARAANFYSLQLTNRPPLPFLPFDVPVYDLGGGLWAYAIWSWITLGYAGWRNWSCWTARLRPRTGAARAADWRARRPTTSPTTSFGSRCWR